MFENGAWFPWMLVAILFVSVGANIYLIVRATNDPSFAVEPDYYAKAVEWDDIQSQRAASEALGWSMVVDARHTELRVRLTDPLGRPIEDAIVGVEAFHNARASERIVDTMTPRGEGVYVLEGSFERSGIWEVRLEALRDGRRFTHVTREELP